MPRSALGRAVRDPVLLGLAVGTAVLVAGYLAGVGDRADRVRTLWATQPVLDALLAWVTWRIARSGSTPAPARRFFHAFTVAGCSFAVGDGYQTVLELRASTPTSAAGTVQSAFFVVGVVVLLIVMLTYPAAVDSPRQRLRFWLDAGTVLVGAGGLVWVLTAVPGVHLGSTLLSAGLLMVAAFAAVKLLLSGQAPMTRAGAWLCIVATALQGVAVSLAGRGDDGLGLALHLLPSVLIVVGPRVQELEMRADPRWAGRYRRRSYSLLPYLMVVAADAALAYALRGHADVKVWGSLGAVLVITALVVLRQLDSFVDNQQLIGRLDASLAELGRHEQRFRSLLAHSSDIILLLDAAGTVTYTSPAAQRVLGLPPERLVGRRVGDLVHPDDLAETVTRFRQAQDRPRATVVLEARLRHADGSWRRLEAVGTNLLDDPSVAGIVCNARDVTENREFQERLRYLALHDSLTGLPNRALFTERLTAATGGVALLLIDLDDFKMVNDTLGHAAGDAVLSAVAQRLRGCIRPDDTAARLGGDEFAVLLPGASAAVAARVADRLRAALAEPVLAEGALIPVRASIGIAETVAGDGEVLLRRADSAMYAAKQRGKNGRQRVPG
ncbi:MAG: hypothetical protein AUG44_22055 [Actinobacteria bacterium 13_1_20CM_3_71_11]|nr:MAG: hypothetical protein AUG44_22055 [Actinobacteria bacterium 13_1_20CM_3_71_11]